MSDSQKNGSHWKPKTFLTCNLDIVIKKCYCNPLRNLQGIVVQDLLAIYKTLRTMESGNTG